MAEESDLEKTEAASPRRLEQAREDGDVPRSRELATCSILLAAGLGFAMLGEGMIKGLNHTLASSLSFERSLAFDTEAQLAHISASVLDALIGLAPFAVLLVIVALGSPMLLGGWMISAKGLQPDFSRMNLFKGIGNMISVNGGVELLKAIGKTFLVGIVAWFVIKHEIDAVLALSLEPIKTGSAHLAHILLTSFIAIVGGLVVIAMIDVPYQLWHYADKLKMTRQELRQEAKESDGNPEIKAKIRRQQREIAQRRMMEHIPTADVVVTNPTHYAVALKYTDGKMGAPQVVAKGADVIAAKIRELAAENNVPMLEAPPLARALYRYTEIGDEIPEALYTAVAEVLAYVFQLRAFKKHGGVHPELPGELDVPPQLDPLNPASKFARMSQDAATPTNTSPDHGAAS
jgi:flagellar biosynthetic protein FlhB